VKILADGAVATLPSSSGNAVLSVSNKILIIGFHLIAASEVELKTRLSLSSSVIGPRHVLRAAGILASSLAICTMASSISIGLWKRQSSVIVR
jgi:hypothetical protein